LLEVFQKKYNPYATKRNYPPKSRMEGIVRPLYWVGYFVAAGLERLSSVI